LAVLLLGGSRLLDGAKMRPASANDIDPAKRRELRWFLIFSPLPVCLKQRGSNPERRRGVEEQRDRARIKLDVN
jgi:hypothetical protein